MARRHLGSAGTLLVAAVLAACGGAGTESAAAGESDPVQPSADEAHALPSGWTRVSVDTAGFSLGLPDDWQEITAQSVAASGVYDEIGATNPDLAPLMDSVADAIDDGRIALFALDMGKNTEETGFAANVNVLRSPGGGRTSADLLVEAARNEIAALVPVTSEVTGEVVELPAGRAARIHYRWTVNAYDNSHDVDVTQYLIPDGDDVFIVSMTAVADLISDYEPIWTEMANSFEAD